MKIWSDHKILGTTFSIELFIDTNILEYLFNNEYPNLTNTIEYLNEYPDFITLKVSRYVYFEYFEIRKRAIFKNLAIIDEPEITERNIRKFNSTVLNFELDCIPAFQSIFQDISDFFGKFNIEQEGEIHGELWGNTFDIMTKSKLSREDSLVTVSAIRPDPFSESRLFCIITNDQHFHSSIQNNEVLDNYFVNKSLIKPVIWFIGCNDIENKCFGRKNLTEETEINDISTYSLDVIKYRLFYWSYFNIYSQYS
jgi:hypothetical protein